MTDAERARQWVRECCPHNPALFKPDCADLPGGWCLADLVAAVRAEAEAELAGYSPILSCCRSAKDHVRHRLEAEAAARAQRTIRATLGESVLRPPLRISEDGR